MVVAILLPALSLVVAVSPVLAYEEYQENGNTYIFGEITENTTWTKEDSPYVVTGNITVAEGKTLTVEPGAEIRFDGYDKKLTVNGTLSAIGDKDNYITFTSNRDNPDYWNWRGIMLEDSSENNIIQYAVIEYANTGIQGDRSSVTLKNSILRNLGTGVSNIKDSNISYNDFLNIKYNVFESIRGDVNITNNYISGEYRTAFYNIDTTNNIEFNNIDISENIEWFINYASGTNFENNYWGTNDKNYIQLHINTNSEISFEPYLENPDTFDLTAPENDSLITNTTNDINFQWNPINGSGENLSHYNFYIDGELEKTDIAGTDIDYDISSLLDGYHEWYVKAVKKDGSEHQSNEIFVFNINYQEPHPPIATVSSGECSEIDSIMWCYDNIDITLSAENSKFITYTLDGTEPEPSATTSDSTFLYAEQIAITTSDEPITLKAKSWNTDGEDYIGSVLFEQEYQFDLTPPETPTADPVEGLYDSSVSVALSSADGVIIRYTTNGITPTKYSNEYTDKILINSSTVLKAIAWDEHGNKSKVMEKAYFIENSSGGGDGNYYPNLKILPDQGAYIENSGSKTISLTANEETAKICYTIDGNEPTEDSENSTCVDGKTANVDLTTGDTTLKVRAWSTNGSVSDISSKEYFIYDHGTYITESIYGETTWGVSGSPYVIKKDSNIGINNDLTIEPGAKVILNNNSRIESRNGKIEALGNSDNLIVVKNVSDYKDQWQPNLNVSNSELNYVKFDNINLNSSNSSIVSNSIFDNSMLSANSSEIKNNKFINAETENYCSNNLINLSSNTIFSNNYIKNIEIKSGCNYFIAMITIQGNDVSILRNEFVKADNSSDVQLFDISSGSNIKINNNNFNVGAPDNIQIIKNNSEMKVDMRNNYWGSNISESQIPNFIYDFYDDNSLGEVYYNTYAGSAITFDLIYPNGHTLNNSNINFQWKPLAGNEADYYKLYIDNSLVADNITATNYDYSESLENKNYTWHIVAVKDEAETESRQRYSFTIDSGLDFVIAQPKGGTYITNQTVILSHPDTSAIIRYTLDGREPTKISAIYVNPIQIESDTVLKIKAWYGENESNINTETYIIDTTPPQINSSSAILSKRDTSYNSGSSENILQGIVGEASSGESQTVGLIATIDKAAVCKYSLSEKGFTSINDYWYNSSEGIFRSSDGTATNLIAPLGNLSEGDYKYFVICSDGVDESKTIIEFTRNADSVELHPVLSVSSISLMKPTATANNNWENGWQWIFGITVPDSENKFGMKFNDWYSSSDQISVTNNMRYYSPQAETASTSDNAIIITQANEYPETSINLTGDINQNESGRQIQVIVDMKIPEETLDGSYSTNYGLYSSE